eukprot:7084489-Pyramimonas_sp.AAC.1
MPGSEFYAQCIEDSLSQKPPVAFCSRREDAREAAGAGDTHAPSPCVPAPSSTPMRRADR